MKKTIFILGLMLGSCHLLMAQAPLEKGRMQLNAGLGLSNHGLPVYGSAEFGVGNNISVGGGLTYRSDNESYNTFKWKNSYTSITGFSNYHFNELMQIPSNFDVYAGLSLGYSFFQSKLEDGASSVSYSGSGSSGFYLNAQIGGRYFFSDKLGINLEFGGGSVFSGAKFGITLLL